MAVAATGTPSPTGTIASRHPPDDNPKHQTQASSEYDLSAAVFFTLLLLLSLLLLWDGCPCCLRIWPNRNVFRESGAIHSLPIPIGQTFRLGCLLLAQLKQQTQLEDAELIIASLRGAASLYRLT